MRFFINTAIGQHHVVHFTNFSKIICKYMEKVQHKLYLLIDVNMWQFQSLSLLFLPLDGIQVITQAFYASRSFEVD